ncbi:MAG: adenylosuccinate lyase, partial [Candidatus Omnitrophota bacterium]
RDKAYRMIQRTAMKTLESEEGDFKENLLKDKELLKALKPSQIASCFDLKYYLRNIDKIFRRIKL